MAKQKREKVNRDFSYQDIIDRLGEDEDVSFERVGDTIIIRREEPSARRVREEAAEPERYVEEKPHFERAAGLSGAEEKLFLVKKEIEKRKFRGVTRKDYEELNEAFSRLERRLESLDKELRSLRVELGYLRGVMLDKLRATREEPVMEKVEQPKVEAVAVGKEEKQLQLIQDDIPEMRFEGEETSTTGLGFLASTLSNIYNSLFLGAGEERDVYKEFQKKLFFLVRAQPRSLDEIAERTGESKANCLIWLTRMVDEGLLEEAMGKSTEGKRVYRILWERIR